MNTIHTFEEYLVQLERSLRELPANEREAHVNEIRDHLLELTEEKRISEKELLENFLSPKQMSEKILLEERNHEEQNSFELPNYWFSVTVLSVVAPFGALALPLINETIDIGLYLPFLLQFIIGAGVLFGYYNKKLTERRGEILRKIGRVMVPILSLPFALFAVSVIRTETIETFNIVYITGYSLIWFVTYVSMRRLYRDRVKVTLIET